MSSHWLFEWDQDKNRKNITKHRVSFEDAALIFDNPTLELPDHRFHYGEERSISIGVARAVTYLVVVHTDRGMMRRIISARRAEPKERRLYERAVY